MKEIIAITFVIAVLGAFAAMGKTSQNTSRPPEYQPKAEMSAAPRVMQTVTCTPTPPPTPPGGNPKKK